MVRVYQVGSPPAWRAFRRLLSVSGIVTVAELPPEVRSALTGALLSLGLTPLFNSTMIARQEDVWHLPTLVLGRLGVDGFLEKSAPKGLRLG